MVLMHAKTAECFILAKRHNFLFMHLFKSIDF